MATRCGDTLCFTSSPVIGAYAAVGGKKESKGPLGSEFDVLFGDNAMGEKTWEKAETDLITTCARKCMEKAQVRTQDISLALSGDLQAQCTASNYAMRELDIPYAGLFGACSTMAEALGLGASLCSAGLADQILAMASSHFCAAERQFRTPLEYGGKRTPTAQWTATAAGACILRPTGKGVRVKAVTFGRVQDYQVKDINNMGAAMAPAAAATLLTHLRDTGTNPQDYDVIFTGDLGRVGSELMEELMHAEGVPVNNHQDCGCLLYDTDQKVKSGGSGPGCCASVLCAHILPRLEKQEWHKVLFIATGALMSQTTYLQKETIPSIAHLVSLEAPATM
jgi:stage V sporulation protein AD